MVDWNDAFWVFFKMPFVFSFFSFCPLHSRSRAPRLCTISTFLIWRFFPTWGISAYIYCSKETKKDKKGSKYHNIKNDLAAAIFQIRRSKELNKKREPEYQETLAAMQRRIQELEGRNPFSFVEFYNLNEMSPI